MTYATGLTSAQLAHADAQGAIDVPESDIVKFKALLTKRNAVAPLRVAGDYPPIDMRNADLEGIWLEAETLTHVNLSGANLKNAYLANARLAGVTITNANLQGANLANTTGLTPEQKAYARSQGALNVPL